jgi:hypothetical protein
MGPKPFSKRLILELTQERNGDLIGHYIGCKKPALTFTVQNSRYDCHFTFKTSPLNHLTTSIVHRSVPGVTPTCLDDGLNPASHPSS